MTDSTSDPFDDPRLAAFRDGLAERYQLVRRLGEGGMAVVLLARDLRHDRLVALKVLHPELTQALGGERFQQEIRLIAGLRHPGIVSIFDSGETAGHLWYSMTYVEGESLRARLTREGQLPLVEAVRITLEAARALDAAHQAGVVHRDIKPENLLLDSAGAVLVVDFGVARSAGSVSLTRTGLTVGTPIYMSPEQAAGATVDARSDVYTLACVLYEMLAGEPPFSAMTPQAVSAKHLHAPVPDVRIIRASVSGALQRVLETALAKSPADRYPAAGAFAADLERALSGDRTIRFATLRKYAAVAAALVIILLGLYRLTRGQQVPEGKVVPTIAVLYFESRDSTLVPLTEGLTEEIIRELTGSSRAFRVISKYGVRAVRGANISADSMRTVLQANYWVSGTISRADGQVIVRAQLIDAQSSEVIDSMSARSAANGFQQLATDAAIAVAAALRRQLSLQIQPDSSHPPSSNALANSLVREAERILRDARYLSSLAEAREVPAAIAAYDRADSLLARASRQDTTWLQPWIIRASAGLERAYLANGPDRVRVLERVLPFAEEIVRRAPNDPSGLELRGTILFRMVGALNSDDPGSEPMLQAEKDLRDAVGRDSLRASAWATLADLLWRSGKLEESAMAAATALNADEFLVNAYSVKYQLFLTNLTLGRLSEAGEWCRHLRIEYPREWAVQQCDLILLRHDRAKLPDPRRAWQLVAELDSLDPPDKARAAAHPYSPVFRRLVAAAIEARAGNTALATTELENARRAAAGDSIMQLDMAPDEAYLLYVLGRRGEAARLAHAALKERPAQRPTLELDPMYRVVLDSLAAPRTGLR